MKKTTSSFSVAAIVLGLFATVMIFFPVVSMDIEKLINSNYYNFDDLCFYINGTSWVFGMELMGEEILEFSFLGCVTYALPLLACLLIYKFEKDGAIEDNYLTGALVCFLVAAVCFLLLPQFAVFKNEIEEAEEVFKLGAGAITGCVVSGLAALCTYINKRQCIQAFMR